MTEKRLSMNTGRQDARVRFFCLLLLLALVLPGPSRAGEERKKDDKVDHISLAALLIKDGHYQRARAALRNVDTGRDDIDLVRFHTLDGLAGLQLEDYAAAIESFQKAIEMGQQKPVIHVYLAQAHFNLEQYRRTIDCLKAAGGAAETDPGLFLIRSQAHWKLEEKEAAWQALSEGRESFPGETVFLRHKFFLLVQLELYRAAAEYGRKYLRLADPNLQDYIALGSALRKSRQFEEALYFFEAALLKFPFHRDALLECTHTYLDMGEQYSASHLLEKAAFYESELAVEAAEVHRRAKNYYRALYWNSMVLDQRKKIKQRLAVLLELEEYGKVAAMEGAVYRVGLLKNDDIAYGLAFAHFKIGDYQGAERYLKDIQSPEVFDKATKLRKAMEDCRESKWLCF